MCLECSESVLGAVVISSIILPVCLFLNRSLVHEINIQGHMYITFLKSFHPMVRVAFVEKFIIACIKYVVAFWMPLTLADQHASL